MQARGHRQQGSAPPARSGTLLSEWHLSCPWCHGWVPSYVLLTSASMRLARHVMVDHPFELRLLEIALAQVRRELAELDERAA
jgi:hypothetical protein